MLIMSDLHFKKVEMPDIIAQNIEVITYIWLLLLAVSVLGLFFCFILKKRNSKVHSFQVSFGKALYYKLIDDLEQGVESVYTFDDLDAGMWSYDKMMYRFWVKDFRKMFYDPGLYDYVFNYAYDRYLKQTKH